MLLSLDDPYLKIAIEQLGLPATPLLVPVIPEPNALNGFCSENVRSKIATDGGELVNGWQFYNTPYWLEAEFHAIWKSPSGVLIDITPSQLDSSQNFFIPDPNRTFDGTYRDNLRINSTGNPLVDGLILVEEAIFKLQDQFYDAKGVGLPNVSEKTIWKNDILAEISSTLTDMIAHYQNETSPCFCTSNVPYNSCCGIDLESKLDMLLKG